MKRIAICISFLLLSSACICQADSLQQQINAQVWKPFILGFETGDDDGFSAVHSKEVIRVSQDDKHIFGYDEYFRKVPDSEKSRRANWKRSIKLRFIQRIASNGKAFEVGYYKSSSTNATTGEKRTGYGKFHVLLRKEKGVWKILMDADANNKTNEEVFLTGMPM